jgi:hypothetical protein
LALKDKNSFNRISNWRSTSSISRSLTIPSFLKCQQSGKLLKSCPDMLQIKLYTWLMFMASSTLGKLKNLDKCPKDFLHDLNILPKPSYSSSFIAFKSCSKLMKCCSGSNSSVSLQIAETRRYSDLHWP